MFKQSFSVTILFVTCLTTSTAAWASSFEVDQQDHARALAVLQPYVNDITVRPVYSPVVKTVHHSHDLFPRNRYMPRTTITTSRSHTEQEFVGYRYDCPQDVRPLLNAYNQSYNTIYNNIAWRAGGRGALLGVLFAGIDQLWYNGRTNKEKLTRIALATLAGFSLVQTYQQGAITYLDNHLQPAQDCGIARGITDLAVSGASCLLSYMATEWIINAFKEPNEPQQREILSAY